jgi:selT/selW/selH-like putative selenoprotein
MDPPKHYQKMVNPKETKYYDVRREEEVYFPRLGSFEVYVDGVLIFSKLKANLWPNY